MALKIIKFPNPTLRKKAKEVKKVTAEIRKLIGGMVAAMHKAPGVGLAAPQVGKSLRIIVVDVGEGPYAVINPVIIKNSGTQIFKEGCLSLPGVEAPVERSAFITLRGLNCEGSEEIITAEGFLATVFQHEIDHLEGTVFIDRVKDPSQIKYIQPSREKRDARI